MKKGIFNIVLYLLMPCLILLIIYPFAKEDNIVFLATIISNLSIAIYFGFKYRETLLKDLKEFKRNIKSHFKIIFIFFTIGFILMLVSNYIINYLVFNNSIASNEAANREILYSHKFIYSFSLCFLTPFIEEIACRLEFKKSIKKDKIFILVSSLIFACLHLLSITSFVELIYIIPYLILGLSFSIIYTKTNNILSNIIAHSLHNLITVIILLI